MEQYDVVASFYDRGYNDWEDMMNRYVTYVEPIFQKNNVRTVLDCSCGTGLQAVGLALKGYDVTGSDISPEMIKIAQTNARKHDVKIDFVCSSFVDLQENILKKFDAVITMDNALPHMLSDEDVVRALKSMRSVLRSDNGICLIDIFNYVTLCAKKRRFIPMVSRDDAIVFQVRDFFDPGRVDLNIVYFVKNNGEWKYGCTTAANRVLTSDQLERFLLEAGFKDIAHNTDVLWVRTLARTTFPTLKSLSTGLAGVAVPTASR